MKPLLMAAIVAPALLATAPAFVVSASAQPMPPPAISGGSYLAPIVVGAAAGATIGALLWPVVVPAGAAVGLAAEAPPAAIWGWGAFMTTRAAVGAVIGGALGWVSAR